MAERLCAGTFFTLLCAIKRDSRQACEFQGKSVWCSELQMLEALFCILYPSYRVINSGNFRTLTSKIKSCARYSSGDNLLQIPESAYRFHRDMKSYYGKYLRKMQEFCDSFLSLYDPEQAAWLGRGLLELVAQDDTISGGQELYVSETGMPVDKQTLLSTTSICLPALLLGLWDYIAVHVPDNTVGAETLQRWKGDLNSGTRGIRREAIGRQFVRPLTVRMASLEMTDPLSEKPHRSVGPERMSRAEAQNVREPEVSVPFMEASSAFSRPQERTGIREDMLHLWQDTQGTESYHLLVVDRQSLLQDSLCIPERYIYREKGGKVKLLPCGWLDETRQISLLQYPAVLVPEQNSGMPETAVISRLQKIGRTEGALFLTWIPIGRVSIESRIMQTDWKHSLWHTVSWTIREGSLWQLLDSPDSAMAFDRRIG